MDEESCQDKNAECTHVQPGSWQQNHLIIRKICRFLGAKDLVCFRQVCKKWDRESYPFWEDRRMRHILTRDFRWMSKLISEFGALRVGNSRMTNPNQNCPELIVFKEYRPRNNCDFECVGAEELRKFFEGATEIENIQYKNFRTIRLRKWNRFGNFPLGQQEGAKWFINEILDKVVHLTLDICNLSVSQGEFFPALCRMTQLVSLTIRGTCFQLRPSFPVEPTMAEISPLPCLITVEMNYEKCTKEDMPRYYFPWNLFVAVLPNQKALDFCYSNGINLDFAITQFSKMMAAFKEFEQEGDVPYLTAIIFMNLAKSNEDPVIPKSTVIKMVYGSLAKLHIEAIGSQILVSGQDYQYCPTNDLQKTDVIEAFDVGHRSIYIKFEDREMRNMREENSPFMRFKGYCPSNMDN